MLGENKRGQKCVLSVILQPVARKTYLQKVSKGNRVIFFFFFFFVSGRTLQAEGIANLKTLKWGILDCSRN